MTYTFYSLLIKVYFCKANYNKNAVVISLNYVHLAEVIGKKAFLANLLQDKMAAILANDNFKCIFMNDNDRIPIRI